MDSIRHIGLFEGIGGFSLAANWMGWKTVAWCEWNEFGQEILKYYFPEAEGFGDITKTDFTKYANTIDILTGGFPCQPYSVAGLRKGKEDIRHLWPEMLRAIREIKPRYVIGENVSGLVNWNKGMVFHEVQTDLEAEGYEVWPYILPACAVNAEHQRERVWFIAHALQKPWGLTIQSKNNGNHSGGGQIKKIGSENWEEFELASNSISTLTEWANRPATPEFYDGISSRLDINSFFKWSNNAYGNAIQPQVAYQIFIALSSLINPNPQP